MPRFATNPNRSSKAPLASLWPCVLLALVAGCSGTINQSPTDGPQDGLAGTRLSGPAADPGPAFGIQRSGVAVRLWTLPPSARLPDRLIQIFDQPKAAGDASEAAEPWRIRGFLAATIPLAEVQQLEQSLATLPSSVPQSGLRDASAANRTAPTSPLPARSPAPPRDQSIEEPSLSIEAATRRAEQARQQARASDATSDANPADPASETPPPGSPPPGSPPPASPRPAEPARQFAPVRVESLSLRPAPEPSVILRALLRDEPWALMQVSGNSQQPSRVPAGQPMLMGRIWPRPGSPLPTRGFAALMRLELTAALAPAAISRAVRPTDAPLPLTDEPLVFDLPHHRALVLSAPAAAINALSSRSGPDVEKPPSLAQALLTTAAGERVVIVLIPTLPGVFTLQDVSPAASSSTQSPSQASPRDPSATPLNPSASGSASNRGLPPREPASVSPLLDR